VCRPSAAQAAWQHRGDTAGHPGPSDLLAILRRLDEHDRKTLLARLPDPARKAFQSLLAWPNESVGANMRHEYLAVEANATVESAKQLIHGPGIRPGCSVISMWLTASSACLAASPSSRC
jgi:hypothetical protein